MSTSLASKKLASSLLDNLENPKTSCFRQTNAKGRLEKSRHADVAANRNMLDGGSGMFVFLQQSYFLSFL